MERFLCLCLLCYCLFYNRASTNSILISLGKPWTVLLGFYSLEVAEGYHLYSMFGIVGSWLVVVCVLRKSGVCVCRRSRGQFCSSVVHDSCLRMLLEEMAAGKSGEKVFWKYFPLGEIFSLWYIFNFFRFSYDGRVGLVIPVLLWWSIISLNNCKTLRGSFLTDGDYLYFTIVLRLPYSVAQQTTWLKTCAWHRGPAESCLFSWLPIAPP